MDSKPVVGIIGGVGGLGKHISKALLTPQFRESYSDVRVLSRSNEPDAALKALGVTWVRYDEADVAASLEGINVLVNTIGSAPAAKVFKDNVLLPAIAATSSIALYFPSEFGADHTSHFHDFSFPEWDAKKKHLRLAADLFPSDRKLKICVVYAGLFLEDSIGPWFGFDTANGVYEAVGNGETGISFTSMDDVGKAVAVLASLPPESVPGKVRLAGDTKSMKQVATIMEKAGAGSIEVKTIDFDSYKKTTLENQTADLARPLRFLMGQGGLQHEDREGGLGNDDELVNPGESSWTWRKVEDLAKETGGKPWT